MTKLLNIQNPDEEFAELSFQYIYDFAYRPGKYRNHDTLRPDDVFGLLMDCGICLESVLPFRGCRTKFHRLGIQDRVRDSYSKGLMVKLDGYGFVQGDTPSEILPAVARQLKNGPLIGTIKTNERFMSHEGEKFLEQPPFVQQVPLESRSYQSAKGIFEYRDGEDYCRTWIDGVSYNDFHCMMIYGHHYESGYGHVFRVQNSYGDSWGKGGRGRICGQSFEMDGFYYPVRASWSGA
ncbi:hypothetical protein OROHE_010754 [Orobanche hederae]